MCVAEMFDIDRESVPTMVLLLLTVTATGAVAATIDSMDGVEGGDRQINIDPRGGAPSIDTNVSANGSDGTTGQVERETIDLTICVDLLRQPPAILAIVAAVVAVLYGSYRRFNLTTAFLIGTGIVPVVWFVYFFLTNCITGGTGGGSGTLFDGNRVISNQGGLSPTSVPPSVAAGIFGVVVVGGIALLYWTSSEEERFEPVANEPEEPETADFARAAGRAADRIEEANATVDNAVYRAWLEMTGLLDISDPETTAPRDFAEAAVDVGLDRDDVSELTELFNEVRYGAKDAETREERAVAILRTIERSYQESADDGSGADSGAGPGADEPAGGDR